MTDALAVVSGVLGAPESHLFKNGSKAFAAFGQRIFHLRRHYFVNFSMHQTVFLQFTKLLGQHLLAGAGDQLAKLAETQDIVHFKIIEQERFILPADHCQCDFDGAKSYRLARVFSFQCDARLQKGA